MDAPQIALIEPDETPDAATLDRAVASLAGRRKRTNTTRAYATAWDAFTRFCNDEHQRRLPASPATVARYLAYLHACGRALKTIRQHKAAIRAHHLDAGHLDPSKNRTVDDVWTGICREQDDAEPRVSLALWRAGVERVVARIDADLAAAGRYAPAHVRLSALRDRALILLFASSARLTTRELHTLRADEIASVRDGLEIRVSRSPDRGVPPRVALVRYGREPYCPVRALGEWLRALDLDVDGAVGPIMRPIDLGGRVGAHPIDVRNLTEIVKRRAALAGLTARDISPRALRTGSLAQGGYDGEDDATLLAAAGLDPDSAPRVAAIAAVGRARRRDNHAPPDGADRIHVGVERVAPRPRLRTTG